MSKMFLLAIIALTALTTLNVSAADEKMKFNYKQTDILKILEDYSKASGQRFIVDPQVRGMISIINPDSITLDEAFKQLSTSLAVNGIAMNSQDGVMVVKQARAIQRDSIPLVRELPPMRPEKMVTWMVKLKYVSADEINKQLRILTSKDGELVPYTPRNELIISDWTPNLHRINNIIKELDVEARPDDFKGKPVAAVERANKKEDFKKNPPRFNAQKKGE